MELLKKLLLRQRRLQVKERRRLEKAEKKRKLHEEGIVDGAKVGRRKRGAEDKAQEARRVRFPTYSSVKRVVNRFTNSKVAESARTCAKDRD